MATDHDEPGPVFDEDFVRGATIKEPSASERARTPSKREVRRMRREWKRRKRASARSERTAAYDDGTRRFGGAGRADVLKLVAIVLVLLAISTGLWWINRPEPEPVPLVPPVVPSQPQQPGDRQTAPPEPVPTRALGQDTRSPSLTFRLA